MKNDIYRPTSEVIEEIMINTFHVQDGAVHTWEDFANYENRMCKEIEKENVERKLKTWEDFEELVEKVILKYFPHLTKETPEEKFKKQRNFSFKK